jgi:hypothetical protein
MSKELNLAGNKWVGKSDLSRAGSWMRNSSLLLECIIWIARLPYARLKDPLSSFSSSRANLYISAGI